MTLLKWVFPEKLIGLAYAHVLVPRQHGVTWLLWVGTSESNLMWLS